MGPFASIQKNQYSSSIYHDWYSCTDRVAKRRNQTLIDMIERIMNRNNFSKWLWDEALRTANCILNRVSIKSVDKAPFELWNVRDQVQLIFIFSDILLKNPELRKFDARAISCYLGCPESSRGYNLTVGPVEFIKARFFKGTENDNSLSSKGVSVQHQIVHVQFAVKKKNDLSCRHQRPIQNLVKQEICFDMLSSLLLQNY